VTTAGRTAQSITFAILTVAAGPAGSAGDAPAFRGRVVLEIPDEPEASGRLRVAEEFSFVDSLGKTWTAPRGALAQGNLLPRPMQHLGIPLPEGPVRRAAVIRDVAVEARTEPWRKVARMYFDANLAEMVSEPEAKVLYAAWYAGGTRWEPRGSSCFRSCHIAATALAWQVDASSAPVAEILDWIWRDNPSLDAIDQRLDDAITRPGPHLFAQPR
jgi:hypothetical protein